jgi:hypothetical protein
LGTLAAALIVIAVLAVLAIVRIVEARDQATQERDTSSMPCEIASSWRTPGPGECARRVAGRDPCCDRQQ